MPNYYYSLIILSSIAVLYIPVKYMVVRIIEKQRMIDAIKQRKQNTINAIDKMPYTSRMKLIGMLKARHKTAKRVHDGLNDIASDLKRQLNELK